MYSTNKKHLVSIIIPVYKVEPYLKRCLDSVITQTYPFIEIILIDDGSPDNCPSICDKYASLDSRILVVHKKNGGLSDARNVGLDRASGEYITFVDSDDWVHPLYVENLLHLSAKTDSDISIAEILKTNYTKNQHIQKKICNSMLTPQKAVTRLFSKTEASFIAACGKLFKTDIIKQFHFPCGKIHEDEYVNYQWLYKAQRIAYTNQVLYFYFQHSDSITGSCKSYNEEEIYQNQVDFFLEKGEQSILNTIHYRRLWNLLNHYWTFYNSKDFSNFESTKKEIKKTKGPRYTKAFPLTSYLGLYIFKKWPFLYVILKKASFFILH